MYINTNEIMHLNERLGDVEENLISILSNISMNLLSINDKIKITNLTGSNSDLRYQIEDLFRVVLNNLDELINFLIVQIRQYIMVSEDAKALLKSLIQQITSVFDSNGTIIQ